MFTSRSMLFLTFGVQKNSGGGGGGGGGGLEKQLFLI